MKVNYKISAVIPTMQYGNIQPSYEFEGADLKEMERVGMDHIQDMFDKYSEKPLIEKGVVTESLISFNEGVEIDFDKKTHTYLYKGNKLEGATSFVNWYIKPFDSAVVANKCEKSWEVPADKIQSMWRSNGDISSTFGTLIHNLLEHYNNYKEQGEKILEKTGKEQNPAIPKHPILKSIILDFAEMVKDEKGEVVSEVLVSDVNTGRCGQIDRLLIVDADKKICRVQDYKINVGSKDKGQKLLAPYDKLPATKMSKYQLQLSFYANLLANSGWTVEGIDVFVYEDKWIHEELSILEV